MSDTESLEARLWRTERELQALQERYRAEVANPYRRGRDDEKREHESLYEAIMSLRKRFNLDNSDGNYGLLSPISARLGEADTYERLYNETLDALSQARDANAFLRANQPAPTDGLTKQEG